MPRARMDPAVKSRLMAAISESPVSGPDIPGRILVVECVRQWIFEGRLRGGDTLSQDDLADILGISRIPVRDGLIALESSGWVAIEPGVGAKTIGLDAASIEDNFEIFNVIWALMIRRAVLSGRPTAPLLAAAEHVESTITPSDMVAANDEFVSVLSHIAQAPRLEAAYRNAGRMVPGDIFHVVPGAVDVQRRHLPQIGRAVHNGDIGRALDLVASQQHAHVTALIQLLTERHVLERGTAVDVQPTEPWCTQSDAPRPSGSEAIGWLKHRAWDPP